MIATSILTTKILHNDEGIRHMRQERTFVQPEFVGENDVGEKGKQDKFDLLKVILLNIMFWGSAAVSLALIYLVVFVAL
ncbi:hypothetical protein KUV65_06650 [Maritalea mobilis]|uniref:hypothetical protein n=1 Tax=Maritalea mobilis TaxID=483324 RepID=UPI001C951114|nr:hypothetical protein [Maritalea mobilis]MBY6201034.1 hypothetical protein [Maritalea mobilis]